VGIAAVSAGQVNSFNAEVAEGNSEDAEGRSTLILCVLCALCGKTLLQRHLTTEGTEGTEDRLKESALLWALAVPLGDLCVEAVDRICIRAIEKPGSGRSAIGALH
jgi:hypothetical protein